LISGDIGYIVWQFVKEEFFKVLALVEELVFLVVDTVILDIDLNDLFV